jgi:hypothetical protein
VAASATALLVVARSDSPKLAGAGPKVLAEAWLG